MLPTLRNSKSRGAHETLRGFSHSGVRAEANTSFTGSERSRYPQVYQLSRMSERTGIQIDQLADQPLFQFLFDHGHRHSGVSVITLPQLLGHGRVSSAAVLSLTRRSRCW